MRPLKIKHTFKEKLENRLLCKGASDVVYYCPVLESEEHLKKAHHSWDILTSENSLTKNCINKGSSPFNVGILYFKFLSVTPYGSNSLSQSPDNEGPAGSMPKTTNKEYDEWSNNRIQFLLTFSHANDGKRSIYVGGKEPSEG